MQLILTGGFLGSGKTTAIQQACSLLLNENKRVAVITNDQGEELVDSTFIEEFSIPVREVTKGCFCCNYNALLENIYYFSQQVNPDIIFAESVGSCTDLIATIAKPLAAMHPELTVHIAVFVDAYLLHSLITGNSSFIDDDVRYIFKKQMEEADVLILNKIDLLSAQQTEAVKAMIQHDYTDKKILLQNSLYQNDIKKWLGCFDDEPLKQRTSLDIDYKIYGAGEAKLAWLDAVVHIKTQKLAASKAAAMLSENIYQKINQHQLIIGHLKFLINDGTHQYKISYTTASYDQNIKVVNGTDKATIIINARVQTSPKTLESIIHEAIKETEELSNCIITIQSLSAFKPGFPKPTHRIA